LFVAGNDDGCGPFDAFRRIALPIALPDAPRLDADVRRTAVVESEGRQAAAARLPCRREHDVLLDDRRRHEPLQQPPRAHRQQRFADVSVFGVLPLASAAC
jgi:hypothetical protein